MIYICSIHTCTLRLTDSAPARKFRNFSFALCSLTLKTSSMAAASQKRRNVRVSCELFKLKLTYNITKIT
jgi:hypothetical protein